MNITFGRIVSQVLSTNSPFILRQAGVIANASEENPNEPANSWRSFDRERFPPQCEGWFMPFKSEAQGRYCEANKNKLERQGRRRGVGAVKQMPESFREGDGN
jgi:hypothetical protein